MAKRLGILLGKGESEISEMLLDDHFSVLGSRSVVLKFNKGIQWNPADDYCYQIVIKTFDTDDQKFVLDGEVYTLKKYKSQR